MTLNDAIDRAAHIWGATILDAVRLRADGGADVYLRARRDLGNGLRQEVDGFHQLDEHGHAVCHAACREHEARADGRKERV